MRLTTVILIASLMQVSASGLAQKITLNKKNESLKSIFKEIKSQTGYNFIYGDEVLKNARPVTINVKGVELQVVLEQIFAEQPFSYATNSNTVIIKDQGKSFLDNLVSFFSTITVKGRILNEKGLPLPNATVQIRGKTTVYKTNEQGEFIIQNVADDAVLQIRYVGYKSLEIPLKNATMPLEIKLDETSGNLEEVGVTINTGYQRIRPEQSTGAVSGINTKQYESRISTDFLSGLVNKIPGLLINNDVRFEGNSLFQIRGLSTINGNKTPLIVVDGYPTELSLDMIDPNEISSVTVLKDAAASTIYGVRASNGVIVIERKQATAGKAKFELRSTFGFTPKEDYSRYRWSGTDATNTNIKFAQDNYRNSFSADSWANIGSVDNGYLYSYPTSTLILAQQAAGLINNDQANQQFDELRSYDNSSDYSKLFLRTAATQSYNLNVSGGNQNALYYITTNYTNNSLTQKNNGNGRFLLSGRTTLNFTKRLSMELSTDFQKSNSNSAPVPDINNIYTFERFQDDFGNPLPILTKSNANPYYNAALTGAGLLDNQYYPLVDMNEVNDKINTVNNRVTAKFNYNIGNGFNLSLGGIYENSRTDARHYASDLSSEAKQYVNVYATKAATGGVTFNLPKGGYLQQQNSTTTSYTGRIQLNYNKQIGTDHSFNAIIGGEIRDVTDQASSSAFFGYSDQTLLQQPVNYYNILGIPFSPVYANDNPLLTYTNLFGQQYADNRYLSGYSNIVYSFRNTYSVTGSLRIDQSNLFGTDPKYRYKPLWSIGAAWNINREPFMKDVSWISSLKLRVADGFNGNVAKNALPQVIARAGINTTYLTPATNYLTLASLANSGLRWEQTRNRNIGLDFNFLNRINGNVDYYVKKSTDILARQQIDPSKGGASAIINSASIVNKGLEVNLNADWITRRRFNWNTGLVFSRNSGEVTKVYNSQLDVGANARPLYFVNGSSANYLKGYPAGAVFEFHWAGLDNTGAPLVYGPNGQAKPFLNTNGTVTPLGSRDDLYYVGSSIPVYNAGLSNRVDFGNFYFYCMINYYGGFKVRVPVPDASAIRPLEGAGNYWQNPGDEKNPETLPPVKYSPGLLYVSATDKYTVNGDYLTLADVTMSYNFGNAPVFKKMGLSRFEVKLQASNLYTVGLNKYNYSVATGNYAKTYLTPTYTIGLFTNF